MNQLKQDVNKQADYQRQRAQQAETAQAQTTNDAIKRRAASLGGGPSGAFVKQEQVARDQSAQRLQNANEGINAQAQAQLGELNKTQQGQEFATGERLGSQQFASGESAIARRYATGEREATQVYNTGERVGAQDAASSMQDKQINAAKNAQHEQIIEAAKTQQRAIEAAEAAGAITHEDAQAQLTELTRQFNTETDINAKNGFITQLQNLKTAGYSPEQIGALFDQLDLASLGINIGDIGGMTSAAASKNNTGPLSGNPGKKA